MDFSRVKTRLGLLIEARHYIQQGKRIRGANIIDEIGKGGMGIVYRATDVNDNLVALKVIAAEDPDLSDELRDRYDREVDSMKTISGAHPVIPKIIDFGDHVIKSGDYEITFPTITMPLYHGRTLADVKVDNPICYVEAICRVLEGLAVMHEYDICHRDVKPENIFLTWADEIKLLDYGIAKGKFLRNLTQIHNRGVVGSPHYMAPEQFEEDPSLTDERTDIYGAGMTLYALITQNPRPIPGSNPHTLMKNMLNQQLPVPSESLPKEWEKFSDEISSIDHIISKMINKDKNKRFSSAHKTLEALKPFRTGHINNYVRPLNLRPLLVEATYDGISDNVFSQIVKERYGHTLWLPIGATDKLGDDPEIPVYLPDRIKPTSLTKNELILGRGKVKGDVLLVEKDGGGVSRTHALLINKKNGALIKDLGSSNGTYIGNSPGSEMKFVQCKDSTHHKLEPLKWVRFGVTVRRYVPADCLRPILLDSLKNDDGFDPGATNIIKFT